jgi:glycosyltransferase involved in cell wall biosynthesis
VKKRILFVSTFRGPSGYSVAARGYLKCLDSYLQANKDAFELKLYTWNIELAKLSEDETSLVSKYELENNDQALKEFCQNDYEVVWFLTPGTIIDNLKFKEIFNNSKKNTSCVVWETDRVPDFWLDNYKKYFNQIIVPCDWNKQVFSEQTGLPTYKIPYLINFSEPSKKQNKKIFNILSMSQWATRKGFDLLIKAYCSEFFHQEDVMLTIKTYGFGPITGKFQEDRNNILSEIKNYKNSITHYADSMKCKINVVTGLISRQEIDIIIDNSHVFCLPTRGEGFGLTIAESLSRQIPVIVPDKGGHIDYMHKNNFFINSRFMTVTDAFTRDYSSIDMKLIETDLDDIRTQLRKAYNMWKQNPEQLENIGLESRKFLQEYCNPQKITEDLISVLLN